MKHAPPHRAERCVSVARQLRLKACAALAAACLFGALLLLFNVGSLASLLAMSPAAAPAYVLGALTSFAPIVICTWGLLPPSTLRANRGRAT